MNGVFNIISLQRTSWYGVPCSAVWYMIRNAKAVADNVSDRGHLSIDNYL